MECAQENNRKNCPCTYEPCSRKGNCCKCLRYHRRSGELPACFFHAAFEKSYDRSVENFIAMVRTAGMRVD